MKKEERDEMKKLFLNCWCNFKWNSFIKDYKNCWNYVTCCKQCGKSLVPVWRLSKVRLFDTQEEAQNYRSKIFENPETFLLWFMIPWPWEDLNKLEQVLLNEAF
jgi:hypothetical protein